MREKCIAWKASRPLSSADQAQWKAFDRFFRTESSRDCRTFTDFCSLPRIPSDAVAAISVKRTKRTVHCGKARLEHLSDTDHACVKQQGVIRDGPLLCLEVRQIVYRDLIQETEVEPVRSWRLLCHG